MASFTLFLFFFLCYFEPHSAEYSTDQNRECPKSSFRCGKLGEIKFPYTTSNLSHCGVVMIDGCDKDTQRIKFEEEGRWYDIQNISRGDEIFIHDQLLSENLSSRDCKTFNNLGFPTCPYVSFQVVNNLTIFKCGHNVSLPSMLEYGDCSNFTIYYPSDLKDLQSLHSECPVIQLPVQQVQNNSDIFARLTANFSLKVKVSSSCYWCHYRGGYCETDRNGKFHCANSKGNNKLRLKLGLGLGLAGGIGLLGLLLAIYITRRHYKKRNDSSDFLSTNSFSRSNLEGGGVYLRVSVFSYAELEKATSSFDNKKELGDGGFGTVYYGKLKDGREVAVKRLYQHNYKRVEQFMNEIDILTRLRHKNLVTLYGCTSRRCRELLLVYEYVPNGTVADHLHGDRAKSSTLTWPIRMSIAMETASALAYLHASDIIHRDVKTNNILLDKNFCVKVADFGLSRLFPNDVTHVSTAPQGTPGYVDPEYHQCYQLTSKSDVYSFGVVLVELISSMPAVDISRHRHEINLANFAVNKIQQCAFNELIDSFLGYGSDEEVKRTTILVAELAFRCLQQDKEMRPSMDEVLEELKRIESKEYREREEWLHDEREPPLAKTVPPTSPPNSDEASLLKSVRMPPPPSPDTVTAQWSSSSSTTPNISS